MAPVDGLWVAEVILHSGKEYWFRRRDYGISEVIMALDM